MPKTDKEIVKKLFVLSTYGLAFDDKLIGS